MTREEADSAQQWAGMDGATAWHLIDRHADDWNEVGELMNSWLRANGGGPWISCAEKMPVEDQTVAFVAQAGQRRFERTAMEQKLWAMLIPGPDDVWAMPSKEAADEAAAKHNEALQAGGFAERWGVPLASLEAVVTEWPHDAESHAYALANQEPDVMSSNDLGIPDGVAGALGL